MTQNFVDRTAELNTNHHVLIAIALQAYHNLRYGAAAKQDVNVLPPDVEAEAIRIWDDPNSYDARVIHEMIKQSGFDTMQVNWGQTTLHAIYHRKDLPDYA